MIRAEFETELTKIAAESMHCQMKCEGVENLVEGGIRSRYVMISGLDDRISCVIVSLAPPRMTAKDLRLLGEARNYKDALGQYRSRIESTAFFAKLEMIRRKLGFESSAIWTTLCKCERIKGEKLPSDTVQECIRSHFMKELELIDKSVPIVALGNRTFATIRQSFPEHFVLNVPSPDGPRGDFQKTVDNERLMEFAKARMAEGKPGAVCLCPPCARRHLT